MKLCVSLLCCVLLGSLAPAEWAVPEQVPVDRLIKNYEAKVKAEPNNANYTYVLARLHSLAFASSNQKLGLFEGGGRPTEFEPWKSMQVKPEKRYAKLDKDTKLHLTESVRLYAKAYKLDPKVGVHGLGYAWMLEQASSYAKEIGAVEGVFTTARGREDWLNRSLVIYRAVYKRFVSADINGPKAMYEVEDAYVSQECAEGIIRIIEKESVGSFRSSEKAELTKSIETLGKARMGITPIIFPVNSDQTLASLIDAQSRSRFDLAGDGIEREWPWVTPSAAFLVWDPAKTGVISSGRQLFGSATFWMFFQDGYEALASLDDDGDGWLKEEELRGIAVWQDIDSDGVSDPGEVKPVDRWSVLAIRTAGVSDSEGVLTAPLGIIFKGGRTAPTYDWKPASLPSKS